MYVLSLYLSTLQEAVGAICCLQLGIHQRSCSNRRLSQDDSTGTGKSCSYLSEQTVRCFTASSDSSLLEFTAPDETSRMKSATLTP